jgi:hypothetical protein
MSGTTSIDELPLPGIGSNGGGGGAVQMQVQEMNEKVDTSAAMKQLEAEREKLNMTANNATKPQQTPSLSQEETSQLVSGLQQASQGGVLSLPSRDIPMDSAGVKMDQEAHVNYIPSSDKQDYIGNTQTADEIIMHSNKMKNREDTMDTLYEEIQTPLLIAILFFIFMVPSVRGFLFKSFPSLLQTDGNPTLGGYMYIATLFGLFYYILNKLLHHFSQV